MIYQLSQIEWALLKRRLLSAQPRLSSVQNACIKLALASMQADHTIRTMVQLNAVLTILHKAHADEQQVVVLQNVITTSQMAEMDNDGREAEQSLRLLETLTDFSNIRRKGRFHGIHRRTR